MSPSKTKDSKPSTSKFELEPKTEMTADSGDESDVIGIRDFRVKVFMGRVNVKVPEAEISDEPVERKLLNLILANRIIEDTMDFRQNGEHNDENKEPEKESDNQPEKLFIVRRGPVRKEWISLYDLHNAVCPVDEQMSMIRKTNNLKFEDYREELGDFFINHCTEYDPDEVFSTARSIFDGDCHEERNFYIMALALLKSTFCTGPLASDPFVFMGMLFDKACISDISADVNQFIRRIKWI